MNLDIILATNNLNRCLEEKCSKRGSSEIYILSLHLEEKKLLTCDFDHQRQQVVKVQKRQRIGER